MNCCSNCFIDSQIKSIIESEKYIGKCDLCGCSGVPIYNFSAPNDKDSVLKSYFADFLDTYDLVEPSDKNYKKAKDLLSIFKDDWNIFNLDKKQIRKFLINLFPEMQIKSWCDDNNKFIIKELFEQKYIKENSILPDCGWADFVEEIKFKNRFHSELINKKAFDAILDILTKEHEAGTELWRGRIWNEENRTFTYVDMGAPPKEKVKAGRVNSDGIRILYLGDSKLTVKYETRANLFDKITIGKFILKKDITIVDFTEIGSISPFYAEEIPSFIKFLAINKQHLLNIEKHISKPHRRNDNKLDYLPTQYICDYIKSKNIYSGIKYKSTLHKKGFNLAVFDPNLFDCTNLSNIEINSISYNSKEI